jgi:hypothetical protein
VAEKDIPMKPRVIDERLTAAQNQPNRTTAVTELIEDVKPNLSVKPMDIQVSDLCFPSPGKMLVHGMSLVALLALAGFLSGLAQGEGKQFLLGLCCGAIGVLVVFLGYGPIANVVGFLGSLMNRFRKI